ncbi:MAG: PCMD domain-containing protein [Muribaculaceae bacterium]|nr:PCMD domain-containing protein [Muribaculaceae bacterium]
MKTYSKYFGMLLMSAMVGGTLVSCTSENPFGGDGEGTLRMRMVINSDVTRAETDYDALRAGCVVYISGAEGLMHKYVGLENVPEAIPMKTGHYVAEAWSGDSVPASFTSKFFRGYQPFDVAKGENQVVVNCRIANTVVSVNNTTIDSDLMKDWTITVANGPHALTFNEENVATDKAYFMMPSTRQDLDYTIVGITAEGKDFIKKGQIKDVQRAHEYVLNLMYNPTYQDEGGAFVTVIIDDTEISEKSEIEILGAPAVKGADFDIEKQLTGNAGGFLTEKVVKVSGFNGLKSVVVSSPDWEAVKLPAPSVDLLNATEQARQAITASGLTWDYEIDELDIASSYLHFSREWLNALPERDTEYCVEIAATDVQGKTISATLRLAVGEGAVVIEDPVVTDVPDPTDLMAVRSTSATVPFTLADEAVNPGIEYRANGESDWQFKAANLTRATQKGSVTLTGLRPGTRYEYRAVADGFTGETFLLTTETTFTIPNASMEQWSNFADNSKVLLPGEGGQRTFWDSGNHGSATMSVTLTQGSTDMFHSGTRSARLRSQFVGLGGFAGKFAAGNLFAGTYLETQGTDGRLEFGRQYDGSHPTALSVWVNYRPGIADKNGSKGGHLSQGDLDKGQIYVALSTEPVEVRTKASTRKLFDPKDDCIVAYGQYTFEGNFGPEGALQRLEIPIEYYAKAKSTKPLYLIIVCSASYYGDYFDGGEGSLMYVDDFELLYE